MDAEARRIATEILLRAPVDWSRRASYGHEERLESVTLHWPDGHRQALVQTRDDRISFALRDHYQRSASSCRDQIEHLVAEHGHPAAVLVAWRYEADWEGVAPINLSGRCRFPWPEVRDLLRLPGDDSRPPSAILPL